MILLYAGRRPGSESFPAGNVSGVTAKVGETIDALRPDRIVGSAAAGADLIVLEAALRRSIPATVLLAGDRDAFRAGSVADKGEAWARRYDALLDNPLVTVREVPSAGDPDDTYRAVTREIAAEAERVAAGAPIAVLAVSVPRPPGEQDHTEELVTVQREAGRRVVRIDPAQPDGGTLP